MFQVHPLRFITDPDETTLNRAARRRITSQASAANYFNCHVRTIRNWIERGFIHGFQDRNAILVDIDEIEAALLVNDRMRDGRRKRYGADAKIVPLPLPSVR